jgi:predicted RNase H-like HicB family nuclease
MKKGTLIYWRDGEWLVGRLRERPDVFSQGKNLNELEANIKEALRLMQETDLEGIPAESNTKEILLEA